MQDTAALNVLPTLGTPRSGSLFLASPHTRSHATLPPAPPLSPAQSSVPSMAPSYLDYVDGHDGPSLPSIALLAYDGASGRSMSPLSGPRTGASVPSGPLPGYSLTPPPSYPASRGGLAHRIRSLSQSGALLWAHQHAVGAAGPSSLSNASELNSYADVPLPAPVSRRRGSDDDTKASAARLRPLQALAPLRTRPSPPPRATVSEARPAPQDDGATRMTSLSNSMSSFGMQPPAYVFPNPHDNPSFQPWRRRAKDESQSRALPPLASQDDVLHLQRSPAPVAVGRVCEPAWPSLQARKRASSSAATSDRAAARNHGAAATSMDGDRSLGSHLPRSSSSLPPSAASAPTSPSHPQTAARSARRGSGALDALRTHGLHPQPGPWATSEAAALLLHGACAACDPRAQPFAARYAATPPARSPITSLPASGQASPPVRAGTPASVADNTVLSITLHRTLDAQGRALATRTSMHSTEHDTISEYAGFLNVPQSFLDPTSLRASPATAAGDPSAHFGDSAELSRHVAVHGTPQQSRKQPSSKRQRSPRGRRHAADGPPSSQGSRQPPLDA